MLCLFLFLFLFLFLIVAQATFTRDDTLEEKALLQLLVDPMGENCRGEGEICG